MPTKATLKYVKRLQQKKYRKITGEFVVEGKKSVEEFLESDYKRKYFFVSEEFKNEFPEAEVCTIPALRQMSGLATTPEILAVFEQKTTKIPSKIDGHYFALDNIKDPGNLGTIIRLADWFGMKHLFCNTETVDVYNPKVVQACMGSLTRVDVHFLDLNLFLKEVNVPVYGTFMQGENIYTKAAAPNGIIVLGNEANGISAEIEKLCTDKITIPQVGKTTESLNVAVASAIIAAEFYRKTIK